MQRIRDYFTAHYSAIYWLLTNNDFWSISSNGGDAQREVSYIISCHLPNSVLTLCDVNATKWFIHIVSTHPGTSSNRSTCSHRESTQIVFSLSKSSWFCFKTITCGTHKTVYHHPWKPNAFCSQQPKSIKCLLAGWWWSLHQRSLERWCDLYLSKRCAWTHICGKRDTIKQ